MSSLQKVEMCITKNYAWILLFLKNELIFNSIFHDLFEVSSYD